MLEELITQLDASGLTDGRPKGMMWDFQRDGLLPFERESIPAQQRIPVNETMLGEMEPNLIQVEESGIEAPVDEAVDDEGWSPLPPPAEEDGVEETLVVRSSERTSMDLEDERAQLEAELARLDAERGHRTSHASVAPVPKADSALADLESRLSDVEF